MTTRTARPLGLLAGLAILVAACGGPAATNAPGQTNPAAATQAPVVTQGPAGTASGQQTFDTSSFHADVDLEDLFPDEIAGEPLEVLSMNGADFLSGGSSPEFDAMLSALGKSASDLSVAFGGATIGEINVTIVAFQVEGVPGSSILAALINAFQAESEATITDMSFGGKSVKKIAPADSTEDISYVYTTQDVIFAVGGEDITDALLNEAFSKLP